MDIFVRLLGPNGIMIVSGLLIFLVAFKYSVNIFDWIEKQTIGTRTYILEKLELLFIEVEPQKITYLLLCCSFVPGLFIISLLGFLGAWIPGLILGAVVIFLGFKLPKPFIDFMIELRDSGVCNMMGAGEYLMEEFDINKREAKEIVIDWMKNAGSYRKEN